MLDRRADELNLPGQGPVGAPDLNRPTAAAPVEGGAEQIGTRLEQVLARPALRVEGQRLGPLEPFRLAVLLGEVVPRDPVGRNPHRLAAVRPNPYVVAAPLEGRCEHRAPGQGRRVGQHRVVDPLLLVEGRFGRREGVEVDRGPPLGERAENEAHRLARRDGAVEADQAAQILLQPHLVLRAAPNVAVRVPILEAPCHFQAVAEDRSAEAEARRERADAEDLQRLLSFRAEAGIDVVDGDAPSVATLPGVDERDAGREPAELHGVGIGQDVDRRHGVHRQPKRRDARGGIGHGCRADLD